LALSSVNRSFYKESENHDNIVTSFLLFSALNSTVESLNNEGYRCSSYVVDISDPENVYDAAKQLKDDIGIVDILVNNAGIVNCRTLLDIPDKGIEKTFAVNILSNYWVSEF
jgi:all-trans-retinol dehydrogenase (NAD+)